MTRFQWEQMQRMCSVHHSEMQMDNKNSIVIYRYLFSSSFFFVAIENSLLTCDYRVVCMIKPTCNYSLPTFVSYFEWVSFCVRKKNVNNYIENWASQQFFFLQIHKINTNELSYDEMKSVPFVWEIAMSRLKLNNYYQHLMFAW